jgi:FKBP-type peptidyl-prolyl cis-trans isomerase 2
MSEDINQKGATDNSKNNNSNVKLEKKGFKISYVIGIIVILAFIVIVYSYIRNYTTSPTPSAQVVSAGDNISVYYTGSYVNGTVFQSNFNGTPLNFTVGSGELIKGFGDAVLGMKVGQIKTVTIPENEAYGPVNQSLINVVPLSEFKNQTVNVGSIITDSSGARGIVINKTDTNVTVNFNSPLAGKTLVFKIEVLNISK